jgi:hypothetical protein
MGGRTDSRSSAQCGDAFEQAAAIADVGDAKVFQILVRQSQEDRVVDMVLAKENLIVTIQGTRSADGYLLRRALFKARWIFDGDYSIQHTKLKAPTKTLGVVFDD